MGWMAEQNKRRRERIGELIRKGFSNKELYGQGYASTTVSSVRKELNILDPGDLPTHNEVAKSKGFGRLRSLNPPRRKREKWEEIYTNAGE